MHYSDAQIWKRLYERIAKALPVNKCRKFWIVVTLPTVAAGIMR